MKNKCSIEKVIERRQKALTGVKKVKILGVELSEDPSGQRQRQKLKEEGSMIKSVPRLTFS